MPTLPMTCLPVSDLVTQLTPQSVQLLQLAQRHGPAVHGATVGVRCRYRQRALICAAGAAAASVQQQLHVCGQLCRWSLSTRRAMHFCGEVRGMYVTLLLLHSDDFLCNAMTFTLDAVYVTLGQLTLHDACLECEVM